MGDECKDFSTMAELAYLYTVPLIQMEVTRKRRSPKGANVFIHERALSDHTSRTFTTPNNDTLYSDAWLDLSSGPVTVTMPRSGERYFSVALMDMYTNNFSILGTRTTGSEGGEYTIIGPDQEAPGDRPWVVRAPTNRVWALARTLVDGPDDLDAAGEVQKGLFIHEGAGHGDVDATTPVERSAGWEQYFLAANRLLSRERPPCTDLRVLKEFEPLGIGPDQRFDPSRFSDLQVSEIERGLERGRQSVVNIKRPVAGGWFWSTARRGDYDQDYFTRAVTSISGIGALPPEEAIYANAAGDGVIPGFHDGRKDYKMHFPADALPPVDSFWSISLYIPGESGERFFADVASCRYAIGDRTPGLSRNEDGSLDLWFGPRDPGGAKSSNWVPTTDDPFMLVFRGYIPKPSLAQGVYRLPEVTPL